MKSLMQCAIDKMKDLGIEYGDVRFGDYAWQNISTRNHILANVSDDASQGFGIRALYRGGWGFASTFRLDRESIIRTAEKAVMIAKASAINGLKDFHFAPEPTHTVEWKTSFRIDPFSVPMTDKIGLLIEICDRLLRNSAIKQSTAFLNLGREHKLFLNSQGTWSDQLLMRVYAQYTATAVGPEGFESRTYYLPPLNAGYEQILESDLLERTEQVTHEAVAKLRAADCPSETTNIIILPTHTALTIHETIGHATELDRVLGWEADMAGTSFATVDTLHSLQYAAPCVNVVADRTQERGRASVPIDDDGVQTGRWYLIKNGIHENYATTRSTAQFINETSSRGCSYADSWKSWPILRMPNVSIEPGPDTNPDLEGLIADTSNGILVDGLGSFSIDHQRINFQFGGDCAWRIRNGKRCEVLRRFTYQSHNPVFWNSVDAVCNQSEWRQYGVVNCGKGQPMQVAQLTHGSAPMRLRDIAVGRAKI